MYILCLQEEGKVDVLANEAGDRITPAIVSITDEETVCWACYLNVNKSNLTQLYIFAWV